MLKILEKLKKLDIDETEEYVEDEDSDFIDDSLDEFENLNLNDLSVEEFEKLLGEKHLKKLDELIANGVSESWLQSAELIKGSIVEERPWFTKYEPSSILIDEDLPDYIPVKDFCESKVPDIKTLTSKTPSDFIWNNLLELTIMFSFIYTQFSSKELEDQEVIEVEVVPILLGMCTTLIPSKSKMTFMSAVEVIDSCKSIIYFNSSDHDMNEIFSGVLDLLKHSKILLIMLSELIKWFKITKRSKDSFLAGKKLEFMLSWLNSEVKESSRSVDEILRTLSNIVSVQIENKEMQ